MNARGQIYRAPADEIPLEDEARLDGYLLALEDLRETERTHAVQAMDARVRERQNEAERLRLAAENRRRYQRRHL